MTSVSAGPSLLTSSEKGRRIDRSEQHGTLGNFPISIKREKKVHSPGPGSNRRLLTDLDKRKKGRSSALCTAVILITKYL